MEIPRNEPPSPPPPAVRRRQKRPATDESDATIDGFPAAASTSPSSHWTHSIQNQSFQPKPTAYSPHAREEEDPLMLQQRQCRDKLRALRQARDRMRFYPLLVGDRKIQQSTGRRKDDDDDLANSSAMRISTNMILSGVEESSPSSSNQMEDEDDTSPRHHAGIDALGGLEMLLFAFFSPSELLRVSGVSRGWRALARHDLFWEPLLVTPAERYPMRALLGLERDLRPHHRDDVPAILVYMIFQRLRLAQVPFAADDSTGTTATTATTAATTAAHVRVEELMRRIGRNVPLIGNANGAAEIRALSLQTRANQRAMRVGAVASVHLVCAHDDTLQETQDVTQMAADLHLQAQVEHRVVGGAADAAGFDGHRRVLVNPRRGVGAADDEDVYSVVDGQRRMTLTSWVATKRRVSENTMRAFLRQMLLAVDALERSGCEHVDISPVNIVIHQRVTQEAIPQETDARDPESQLQPQQDPAEEENNRVAETQAVPAEEEDVEMQAADEIEANGHPDHAHHHRRKKRRTPFFQLFFSRRNCQCVGSNRVRARDVALAGIENVEMPPVPLDLPIPINVEDEGARGMAQHRPRLLEAGVAAAGEGGGGAAFAANRIAIPPPSMVGSVINCAITMWSRGRFVDTSSPSLLVLMLRYPSSFPSGLRAFLEYAKYLLITQSASAVKLLRHEYLQCPASQLSRQSSTHWAVTPIRDANEYKSRLVEYYGSLTSQVEALLAESSSTLAVPADPALTAELMPRSDLGARYITKALEEANLPTERFVSVVAPSNASSAWVRTLARTQTHTLQRLDLSRARVPTSVLLQELATLPRLTHLRLPRQILRNENLEHLVAALTYAGLLPRLRGMDENVRQAMDRMERSYLTQLGMVTFLLEKLGVAATTAASVVESSSARP
ncbi:hypothetical protein BBJ28_00010737 [Nothophytophthora sp. Chile5]|nr:hypothetical protein BBJ28_00010737 [Nothophytophthora sp. Chile5]